jgi:multiple sugar transport system permease protein/putative aldouronate transport system permease protein
MGANERRQDPERSSPMFDVVNTVFLVALALLCILPLWYTLCVSLSQKSAASAGLVGLWPVGANLNSYRQIIDDSMFFRSFWVSVQRVVLGATISFGVTVLLAFPLSKSSDDFPARTPLMWTLLICMLFTGGLVPWYLTVRSLGLIDSIWALVLGSSVPIFNVILVMNYFRGLPRELEQAAIVDGAGPWRILASIYVPVSLPVLATVTLFISVYHWNEFFNGLVLTTSQRNFPLQTYIQQVVVVINTSAMTQDQLKILNEMSNQTLNAAKIFIAMLPIVAVYPFFQRYFIAGITLGSVKG